MIPDQVKQKDKVGRRDIDAFEAVMMREDRTQGFFVAFGVTKTLRSLFFGSKTSL